MGYDMRWIEGMSPDQQAHYDAARATFYSACERRDLLERGASGWNAAQENVDVRYEEMMDADVAYFRLNIWGMGVARKELTEVGFFVDGRQPPAPAMPDGMTWDDCSCSHDDEPFSATCPLRGLHEALVEWTMASLGLDVPGIPAWKFSSNDGWIVTPTEIRTAVAHLDETRPSWRSEIDSEYVQRFVDWIIGAADHGGFTVY